MIATEKPVTADSVKRNTRLLKAVEQHLQKESILKKLHEKIGSNRWRLQNDNICKELIEAQIQSEIDQWTKKCAPDASIIHEVTVAAALQYFDSVKESVLLTVDSALYSTHVEGEYDQMMFLHGMDGCKVHISFSVDSDTFSVSTNDPFIPTYVVLVSQFAGNGSIKDSTVFHIKDEETRRIVFEVRSIVNVSDLPTHFPRQAWKANTQKSIKILVQASKDRLNFWEMISLIYRPTMSALSITGEPVSLKHSTKFGDFLQAYYNQTCFFWASFTLDDELPLFLQWNQQSNVWFKHPNIVLHDLTALRAMLRPPTEYNNSMIPPSLTNDSFMTTADFLREAYQHTDRSTIADAVTASALNGEQSKSIVDCVLELKQKRDREQTKAKNKAGANQEPRTEKTYTHLRVNKRTYEDSKRFKSLQDRTIAFTLDESNELQLDGSLRAVQEWQGKDITEVRRSCEAEDFYSLARNHSLKYDEWTKLLKVDDETKKQLEEAVISNFKLPAMLKKLPGMQKTTKTKFDLLNALRCIRNCFINRSVMRKINALFDPEFQIPLRLAAIDGPVGNEPLRQDKTHKVMQQKNAEAQAKFDLLKAALDEKRNEKRSEGESGLRKSDFALDCVPKDSKTGSIGAGYDEHNTVCGSTSGFIPIGKADELIRKDLLGDRAGQLARDIRQIPRFESLFYHATSLGVRYGDGKSNGDMIAIRDGIAALKAIPWKRLSEVERIQDGIDLLSEAMESMPKLDYEEKKIGQLIHEQDWFDHSHLFGQRTGSNKIVSNKDMKLTLIEQNRKGTEHAELKASMVYKHHGHFSTGKRDAQTRFMTDLLNMLTRKNRLRDVLREIVKHVMTMVNGVIPTVEIIDQAFVEATGVFPSDVTTPGKTQSETTGGSSKQGVEDSNDDDESDEEEE
eukprot:TRINITY_DN7182_c0_g1_i5.p1 TRINITY_DN7182_c0_g1~~TRINITY_DN7182_c0_g1_i5.p1  ORF type:complete len:906 (+),score=167.76 TRINITY_DN7182_c0_g1_i5:1618-4335(+)